MSLITDDETGCSSLDGDVNAEDGSGGVGPQFDEVAELVDDPDASSARFVGCWSDPTGAMNRRDSSAIGYLEDDGVVVAPGA